MVLLDVNVLVYAHRVDAPGHDAFRRWMETLIASEHAFGVSDLVLSGFLRVVTHPRVFDPPTPLKVALAFAEEVRSRPNAVRVEPGPRHWEIFTGLCTCGSARGNLVPDAWLAALAVEWGCEIVTTDRDYGRLPGVKWRHPLETR